MKDRFESDSHPYQNRETSHLNEMVIGSAYFFRDLIKGATQEIRELAKNTGTGDIAKKTQFIDEYLPDNFLGSWRQEIDLEAQKIEIDGVRDDSELKFKIVQATIDILKQRLKILSQSFEIDENGKMQVVYTGEIAPEKQEEHNAILSSIDRLAQETVF